MRGRRDSPFGDTVNPELVSVTCDQCGDGFTTDEGTARQADLNGEQLWCESCSRTGPVAPPEREEPRVVDVRDSHPGQVGPDAEPDIDAALHADDVGFGELAGQDEITVTIQKGTKHLGTVAARPQAVDGLSLVVTVDPSLEVLSDEAGDAVVSALSRHTQLLIDIQ